MMDCMLPGVKSEIFEEMTVQMTLDSVSFIDGLSLGFESVPELPDDKFPGGFVLDLFVIRIVIRRGGKDKMCP